MSANAPNDAANARSRSSRRQLLKTAGASGLVAASAPLISKHTRFLPAASAGAAPGSPADGTPEQIHLTWGAAPTSSLTVSWASPGPAKNARAFFSFRGARTRTVPAVQRIYTDGINGETIWTYHAALDGLVPGGEYS